MAHKWELSQVKALGRYDWYYCKACDRGDYHNRGRHRNPPICEECSQNNCASCVSHGDGGVTCLCAVDGH
jgi:hypothetical protein